MRILRQLLDLLFPPRCVLCRRILGKEETDLCRECWTNGPEFPPCPENTHPSRKRKLHFLDSFTAVWYYKGNVRSSILRYKFHHARQYAPAYGRLLAMKLTREHPDSFEVITWAPISKRRKWSRGYDQSELLARAVGAELGIPVVPMLRKTRNNQKQSGMAAEARKANVLGVYAPVDRENIADRRILLVDDIFTTGSTAEECARILLTSGAKQVHAAAIAAVQRYEK